jgi:predicted 3-demethylubiquinone-9 3-methyltransferase (glyoxalase superfamily)
MKKITPCLWFDGNAEEAMNFYISIFKNFKVGEVMRYGDAGPGPKGSVLTVTFELEGQEFIALNGGPMYQFSPAVSFFVNCDTQEEIDEFWDRLSEDGQTQQCGWLTDKYGVTWQIVPRVLGAMLQDENAAKSTRVMQAMLKMTKLDIELLQQAYGKT